MPARNTIEIVINARDNASNTLSGVAENLGSIGSFALSTVATGMVAATGAVVGFTAASTAAFNNFQTGISEVFTLLPGITEEAMGQMESQVQAFMEQVGRTSDETLPALYQALSAGVPQENVFEFLRLANEAAVGGVTDLETAVDGITSVINAYGSDVLSAAEASDLMFTAVRLGKTDFEQLSSSLFNVVPVASALGVGFADITAGLATITAQGVPTSVATTQLRQLFVELGDSATDVAQIFEQAAGQSFQEFIDAGNTTADALGLIEAEANAAGIPLQQMFGSIEAGQAALALTGQNMQNFVDNTAAMGDSAGATQQAFQTMQDNLELTFGQLEARWQSALISMGRVVAPIVQPIVQTFSDLVAVFASTVQTGDALSDWIADLPGFLQPVGYFVGQIGAALFNFGDALSIVMNGVAEGMPAFEGFLYIIGRTLGIDAANNMRAIVSAIQSFITVVNNAVSPVVDFVAQFVTFNDVLLAIGIAIGAFVIPALIGIVAAAAPILLTFGALIAVITATRLAWQNNWLGIRDIVTDVTDNYLMPAFNSILEWLDGLGQAFQQGGISGVGEFIETSLIAPITEAVQTADWAAIGTDIIELIGAGIAAYGQFRLWMIENVYAPILTAGVSAAQQVDWGVVGSAILDGMGAALVAAYNFIIWFGSNVLQPLLASAQTAIENIDWFAVGEGIVNAIGFALTATFNFATWVRENIMQWIVNNSDAAAGQVTWDDVGTAIMNGIGGFLSGTWNFLVWFGESVITPLMAGAITAIAGADWSGVGSALMNALGNAMPNVANWALNNIVSPIQNAMGGGGGGGGDNPLNPLITAGNALFGGGGIRFGRQFGGRVARGMPYLVGEQGAERFVPDQPGTIIPNNQMGDGQPNVTINFNYQGNVGEREARDMSHMITRELRSMGVPITR